jgi:hypothetical protein
MGTTSFNPSSTTMMSCDLSRGARCRPFPIVVHYDSTSKSCTVDLFDIYLAVPSSGSPTTAGIDAILVSTDSSQEFALTSVALVPSTSNYWGTPSIDTTTNLSFHVDLTTLDKAGSTTYSVTVVDKTLSPNVTCTSNDPIIGNGLV